MVKWLHSLRRKIKEQHASIIYPHEGFLPPSQDTFAAIGELSRVVRNNPDAVEIYLALGNLFRSQGEIERAIQIRTNLIARPHLEAQFKARAWYELGLDYKRAGILDRAQAALEQAHEITGDDPAVIKEMARLAADSTNFSTAAQYYALLEQPLPQAHYLVRAARQEEEKSKDDRAGYKLIEKALKVYPGSVEAWVEIVCRDYRHQNWTNLRFDLKSGLQNVQRELRFVLLEGLFQFIAARSSAGDNLQEQFECSSIVVNTVSELEQDMVLCYYCAIFMKQCGRYTECLEWLEKTLVLGPDFWPARLEMLELSLDHQVLTESFKAQLMFFTRRANSVKRFVCQRCGLKREQLFFNCPRCYSWHSISFRTQLGE